MRSVFTYTEASLWGSLRSLLAQDLIPAFSGDHDLKNIYLGEALLDLIECAPLSLLREWADYIQGLDLPHIFKGTVLAVMSVQEPVLKEEHFPWCLGKQVSELGVLSTSQLALLTSESVVPYDTLGTSLFGNILLIAPITPNTTGGMLKFIHNSHSFYAESIEDGLYDLLIREITTAPWRRSRNLEGFYHWVKSGNPPSLYGVPREKDYMHLTSWEDVGLVTGASLTHQKNLFKIGPAVWRLSHSSTHLSVSSEIGFFILKIAQTPAILDLKSFTVFKTYLDQIERAALAKPEHLFTKKNLSVK